jgi:hypothetical protein
MNNCECKCNEAGCTSAPIVPLEVALLQFYRRNYANDVALSLFTCAQGAPVNIPAR